MVTKILDSLPRDRHGLGSMTDCHVLSQLVPALEVLRAVLAPMWPLLGVPKLVPADGALKAAHKWAEVALQQLPTSMRAQRRCAGTAR